VSAQCNHQTVQRRNWICPHLNQNDCAGYYFRFSGRGADFALVCGDCGQVAWDELEAACDQCFEKAHACESGYRGNFGEPEVLIAKREKCVVAAQTRLVLPAPILAAARIWNRWVALLDDRTIHFVDPFASCSEPIGTLDACEINWSEPIALISSDDGRYLAVTNDRGQHGAVYDLNTNQVAMSLNRQSYLSEQTRFPVTFIGRGSETRIIHGTDWNRLDISDPATGLCLTERSTGLSQGVEAASGQLDYFMGELMLSPDNQRMLVDGWVWHPVGVTGVVEVAKWLEGDVWRCEQDLAGPGIRALNYCWNLGKAFVGSEKVILWGIGHDDDHMVNGACLFDLADRKLLGCFGGPPRANFAMGEYLFVFSGEHDTTAWDVATGERVWQLPGHRASLYNPNSRIFLHHEGDTITATQWKPAECQ